MNWGAERAEFLFVCLIVLTNLSKFTGEAVLGTSTLWPAFEELPKENSVPPLSSKENVDVELGTRKCSAVFVKDSGNGSIPVEEMIPNK